MVFVLVAGQNQNYHYKSNRRPHDKNDGKILNYLIHYVTKKNDIGLEKYEYKLNYSDDYIHVVLRTKFV